MGYEDFLQEQAIKRGWHRYYSCIGKVGIGTHPTNGMIDFVNFDSGKNIGDFSALAVLFYERELTKNELEQYGMVAA